MKYYRSNGIKLDARGLNRNKSFDLNSDFVKAKKMVR